MASEGVRDYFRDIVLLNKMLSPQGAAFADTHTAAAGERVVLWLGCNVLRTPHLVQLAVEILRLVTPNVSVLGGPAHCCGAPDPDPAEKERALGRTIRHFQAEQPATLVSWCPSCHFQLRSRSNAADWGFDECHISQYLVEHLDRLPLLQRVPMRVLLHGHVDAPDRERDLRYAGELLAAIPGVSVVGQHADEALGIHCVPALITPTIGEAGYRQRLDAIVQRARDSEADTIVTIYHSCYRELEKATVAGAPSIENYVVPLARSLDLEIPQNCYREVARASFPARDAFAQAQAQRGLDEQELRIALEHEFNPGA